jgi:hypothetical protein
LTGGPIPEIPGEIDRFVLAQYTRVEILEMEPPNSHWAILLLQNRVPFHHQAESIWRFDPGKSLRSAVMEFGVSIK